MAYFTKKDVDKMVPQVIFSEDKYMPKVADYVGKGLITNPLRYKDYGPYWWAMKTALHEYWKGDKKAWFMGSLIDQLCRGRNWHGDLFRSTVAALAYAGRDNQPVGQTDHTYKHSGATVHYSLFDSDAGM